ncbi:ATP-dependent DNA helicase pif1 [Gigaspora margarita]|uniref:ATP-dependent DNA helicase pif1 n=1 Tax=Gigaspora margarita TaxID=4874 RepID=A0A8H3WXE0_GIGMA|nr:ATP-dependent DNA helicase pif1 [Gigaspora margarita]
MFSMATFDDLKSIVRLIIDKIEEGDGYVWPATTAPHISVRFKNISTPEEIKQEIRANLYLDPVQIRTILHNKFDILNITAKQIHYWWSTFAQDSYKMDDDHIISSRIFLKTDRVSGCKLCFELMTDKVTALGFITPHLSLIPSASEVHYFAKINAAKEAWPNADIQLCQWHIDRAIMEKLKSKKRIQYIRYQPEEATNEFDFISPDFIPDLKHTEPEYYQVCPLNLQKDIVNII